jgi:hypothetical protein
VSGTCAIVQLGERGMQAGLTRAEAESFAVELRQEFPDAVFTVTDLLPELEQLFPVGTRVWLGPRVTWRRGQSGTVTAGEPPSFVRWQPATGPVPWVVGLSGAYVSVALDDGCVSWWPSRWLETR